MLRWDFTVVVTLMVAMKWKWKLSVRRGLLVVASLPDGDVWRRGPDDRHACAKNIPAEAFSA